MKDLIISLAVDGRECYSDFVTGLEKSIVDFNWQGDVRIYKEFPKWCTPHLEVPYKFKYDLINEAIDDGYKKIWWLDSTMRLGGDINNLWGMADGVVLFDNIGHPLYKYISDKAVSNLGISESLENILQTWGGAVGFDFNTKVAETFFANISQQIELGSFVEGKSDREGFISHRHDQAVLSGLAYLNGVNLLPYGVIAAKKDATSETIIIYGD